MAIGVPMRSSQESRVDNGEEYLFESERQSPSKYNRKCMNRNTVFYAKERRNRSEKKNMEKSLLKSVKTTQTETECKTM